MVRDSNIGRLAKSARRGIVSTVSAVLAKELEGSAASSSRYFHRHFLVELSRRDLVWLSDHQYSQ